MIDQQDLVRTDLEQMKQAGVDVPAWLLANFKEGDAETIQVLKQDPETPSWLLENVTGPSMPTAVKTEQDLSPARAEAKPAQPQEFPKVDAERELKALTRLLTNPKLSPEQLSRVREIVQLRFNQLAEKRVQ